MMSLSFSSKAQTLKLLKSHLRSAQIAPLYYFTVEQWKKDPILCLEQVNKILGSGPWIVRSSCQREDNTTTSNAGAFRSELNVSPENLLCAIENVVTSYGKVELTDEVLIQPMLKNVVQSGVAFSHDPNTCAPYRVISWSYGDDTTCVTSGRGGHIWQSAAASPVTPPSHLSPVLFLIQELLTLFGNIPVDCEYAITKEAFKETIWLLQARPLIFSRPCESTEQQTHKLSLLENKIRRGMRPHPFLMGQRTVYGVMPDWNPAEIIGIRPKPMAISLYRDLVTDSIWAYQRHNYGYRNLRSFPLIPHFFGLPYVDVRLSFNSFIPADLDDTLAGRLVDHYIDRLLAEPTLHDKVEFEIVFSCYSLDLPERLTRLKDAGFSQADCESLADSLRRLTNRIVHPSEGLWRADFAKLDVLQKRREILLESDADPLERIYWLLEDAKRYGTLPFAGLARAGFIAVQMLRSLVAVGVLSKHDYNSFMESVPTVSGQLARDRAMLDKTTFLSRYGHLRPGTYDLLSYRYDERPNLYFDWSQKYPKPDDVKPFSLTLPQMKDIVRLLKAHGLHPDGIGLFEFLQAGIELRELSKFHFTRNLSDALSLIAAYGETLGFSREDMAFCDIHAFKELHIAAADPQEILAKAIEQGKSQYKKTISIALPPLISKPEDIWSFEWPDTEPNFITQKQVIGPVAEIENRNSLNGAIICIPHADPGFDWLFSYPIRGLITAWGGANSHMAIRAGELGLPAVIGAGEQLFRRWSKAKTIHLDCAGRRVEVLN